MAIEDRIPDAKTIWLYQEELTKAGVVKELFEHYEQQLSESGYRSQKGQIIDASIIPVPKQRNSREENATIKEGKIPEAWESQPHKLSQKDTDARWTKKNGVSYYGYKNHIDIDVNHKLVRNYEVADASVHDSQMVDEIIDLNNTKEKMYMPIVHIARSNKSKSLRRMAIGARCITKVSAINPSQNSSKK